MCMSHTNTNLKRKHSAGQVSPLDFRHIGGEHLISVCTFCVQSIALARPRSTCTSGSLLSLGLKHQRNTVKPLQIYST